MMNLCQMTIHELNEKLKKKEITSREITESVYKRIEAVEDKIKAYITLNHDLALKQADLVDQKISRGDAVPPLMGIPVAIKDNICTKDVKTTCASKILNNFIPPYDATVMTRLNKEEIVSIGKTNMDEFAMGSSTENSHWTTTSNPWDLERIPGGSSGGSAAAVAADECIAALGSDTGGSVRQPAACCGIVGLKPTYGMVSRYGLVAFASSLDQIGPLTRDVTDCAIVMNHISGYDPNDSTSANRSVPDFRNSLKQEIKGLRLGIPKEYFIEGMDKDVEKSIQDSIKVLESLGGKIKEISLPHTEYAVATYYIIATAEASSNLARYDGVKYGHRTVDANDLLEMYSRTRMEGFGPEVKRRIMLGTYALSSGYYEAYYKKAQQVRKLIGEDFNQAFKDVDLIITPTAPTPAFKAGEKTTDPLQMYLSDIFTISINLAAIPAISIPCGFSKESLPIGLQILGRHFGEEAILQAAYAFEQATEFHKRKPAI